MSTTVAALQPAMSAPLEPHSEREPRSAFRAAGRRALAGLALRTHDDVLRFVRADDAGGDHRRADVDGGAGIPEIRIRILRHRRLGSSEAQLRRARPDLWNAGHLGNCAADRRAGQFRHRAVSDRDVPGRPQATAWNRGRIARGDTVDHLRHVGVVRLRACIRRLRPAGAHQDLRRRLDRRPHVPRRAQRHRRALGGLHPLDHGHPVHRLGDARRLRDRAAGAQGVRLRHRRARPGRWSGISCCPIPRSASSAASCSVSAVRSARRWR